MRRTTSNMVNLEHTLPNAIKEVVAYNHQATRQLRNQQQQQMEQEKILENVETFMGVHHLLKFFTLVGVYMPKNYKFLYVLWSLFVNMLVTIYVPIGFFISFYKMSEEEFEMGNLLTSLQAAINDLACATKIIVMFFLLPKLLSCKPILEKLDKRCTTKQELQIIKDFIKKGKRIVMLFFLCYFCYTISACLSAFVFHRLPYNIYNPFFNAKNSQSDFYMATFMEFFVVNVVISQEVASDAYPMVFVTILRTHLGILLTRIENLNSDVTKSLDENLEELKLCIIDHKNILEIYNIVAPIMSVTIFVQFTVTAAILCTTLINIFIFATDFASMVASCFYVLAVVVEIFPLCYSAQCLMDESNRLPHVLFHSNWVDQDKRYRKILIFFIRRSQRTIEFTAGKLFPITLNSFLSIAKFSFSLYTFIEQTGLKEKFAN